MTYITTLVAQGGDLAQFQDFFREDLQPGFKYNCAHNIAAHLKVIEPRLEWDIKSTADTSTMHFRKELGNLVISMLQCGYTVWTENEKTSAQPRRNF